MPLLYLRRCQSLAQWKKYSGLISRPSNAPFLVIASYPQAPSNNSWTKNEGNTDDLR